jgi:hypothetical protein
MKVDRHRWSTIWDQDEAALLAKVDVATKDERMRQLFDTWDADGSGDVDLMELVVSLHKFSHVMEEGSDLKRASDALVNATGNSTRQNYELSFVEFSQLIVQFCEESYGKSFAEMADHMLKVAQSTSERVLLATEGGEDVSKMIADDEEDIEMLRETVLGVQESVVDNVARLKTVYKVNFR